MLDLLTTEVGKVRLNDPQDRRWQWVSRALARQLGQRDWEVDQSFAAFAYTSRLSRLPSGATYAIVVCLDESDCTDAGADLRAAVTDAGSQLLGGTVVLRTAGGPVSRVVRAVCVAASPYADGLITMAPKGAGEIVEKAAPVTAPELASDAPDETVRTPDPTRFEGRIWLRQAPVGDDCGQQDLWEAPVQVEEVLSPGDWVITAGRAAPAEDRQIVSVARVEAVVVLDRVAEVSFDRLWTVRSPFPVVPSAAAESGGDLYEVSAEQVDRLLPGPGTAALTQLIPTARVLRAREIEALATGCGDDVARSCVATLRTGRHLIIRGGPGSGRTQLAVAALRHARTSGLCSKTVVVPGCEKRNETEHSAAENFPPNPFDYRPPPYRSASGSELTVSPTPDKPLHRALADARDAGAWTLVEYLRPEAVPCFAAGVASIGARHTAELLADAPPSEYDAPPFGPWRAVVTTSMESAEIARLLGEDLLQLFGVLDLDRSLPAAAKPDSLSPTWFGEDLRTMASRLADLDLPTALTTPGRIHGIVVLGTEFVRVSAQDGVILDLRTAFVWAAQSLLRPSVMAMAAPRWDEIESALYASVDRPLDA
ncbi:hypothetical protein ACOB87_34755 [Streptomyces sp. YS-B37]|uniref:hypothetical protein n=1 Tax=Streptomyces sp. YS-B37 TaxID=3407669 RepID=UPI003B5100A7